MYGTVGAEVGCCYLILNTGIFTEIQLTIYNIARQLGSKQRLVCWDQLSSKTSSKLCKLCCGTRGGTVWLPTTARPIERCFINLLRHTIYCQGKFKVISSQCFQSYRITKGRGRFSRCSAVTWDTCSALINLLLWSCVCNSNELIELMASSTSWLFTYQTVAPSRWICVSFSTGGHLFLWSNFISISCSSCYGIVIGTMGTQWNSPFYSTDPASCMSLTYICWRCWNKWAFISGNLAEAMQLLRRQLGNILSSVSATLSISAGWNRRDVFLVFC